MNSDLVEQTARTERVVVAAETVILENHAEWCRSSTLAEQGVVGDLRVGRKKKSRESSRAMVIVQMRLTIEYDEQAVGFDINQLPVPRFLHKRPFMFSDPPHLGHAQELWRAPAIRSEILQCQIHMSGCLIPFEAVRAFWLQPTQQCFA